MPPRWIITKFILILFKCITLPLNILFETFENLFHWFYIDSNVAGISNKAVLITGCDSGFGNDAAKHFIDQGAPVFAGCLTVNGMADLQKYDSRIRTFLMDITKDETVEEAKDLVTNACTAEGYTFWGVICNAGITHTVCPADWLTMSDIQKVIDVNLSGTIRTVVTFLPLIKKAKGRVVIMSSAAGYCYAERLSGYAASKFGVRAFAGVLREDLRGFGISLSVIAPGFHATNILSQGADGIEAKWQSLSDDLKKDYTWRKVEKGIQRAKKETEKLAGRNRVRVVSEVYFHAMFNVYPRTEYFVGFMAAIYEILCTMPTRLASALARPLQGNEDK